MTIRLPYVIKRCILAGALLCALSTKASSADIIHKREMAELKPLRRVLDKYQHRYNLDELPIALQLVDGKYLDPHVCGMSFFGPTVNNVVLIRVLRVAEYGGEQCRAANPKVDQKNTVVHELLHILIHTRSEEEVVSTLSTQEFNGAITAK